MLAFFTKLISRLTFVLLAISLVPLAVMNRQFVAFYYDVFSLNADPDSGHIEVPLFILLVFTLFAGFVLGWLASALVRLQKQGLEKWSGWQRRRQPSAYNTTNTPINAPVNSPDRPHAGADLPSGAAMLEQRNNGPNT